MKIICLTEETVETLYLLGRQDFIAGVSQYAVRPPEAKNHPIVTQFIRSDMDKIIALRPDLIIGFSDLQKDIASELIGLGMNVIVTNQRSLSEILNVILMLGRIVGEESQAKLLINDFSSKLLRIREKAAKLPRKPRVFFEEWDHPSYSCIRWVSELIEACGGINIFNHKTGSLARERLVTPEEVIELDPEIIFGCWCGKKVQLNSFEKRFQTVSAVRNNFIWELDPAIFLQPGPALFIDGLDQMFEIIEKVSALTSAKQ
jgi:iron complex transport system substrate-binding protein